MNKHSISRKPLRNCRIKESYPFEGRYLMKNIVSEVTVKATGYIN